MNRMKPAVGVRIVWDKRNKLWMDAYVAGGAPWGLIRISPEARRFINKLVAAGAHGLVPQTQTERSLAHRLVDRGVAHPTSDTRGLSDDVVVVIPVYGRPDLLEACLDSIGQARVVVVDDASPDELAVRQVALAHGASLVRHETNQGPASSRNTGLAKTDGPILAFLDSDCIVSPGWLAHLVAHFDDPHVGIVAPRVRPLPAGQSILARHEDERSALDMGDHPELVRHGARLGFLPSAALVVRRSALPTGGFDPSMRVGEDVDLVWRTIDAGWHVRYDPAVIIHHQMRLGLRDWAVRRFEYGTSAAALHQRHPGRLAPARLSPWNAAVVLLALAGWPIAAGVVAAWTVGSLGRTMARSDVPVSLAGRVVAKGLVADIAAVGHALRREWWPIGWSGLAAATRSRWGVTATAAMLTPVGLEYVANRPALDPMRYTVLRLLADAAYGSGVLVSAMRRRQPGMLLPQVRWPSSRRG